MAALCLGTSCLSMSYSIRYDFYPDGVVRLCVKPLRHCPLRLVFTHWDGDAGAPRILCSFRLTEFSLWGGAHLRREQQTGTYCHLLCELIQLHRHSVLCMSVYYARTHTHTHACTRAHTHTRIHFQTYRTATGITPISPYSFHCVFFSP